MNFLLVKAETRITNFPMRRTFENSGFSCVHPASNEFDLHICNYSSYSKCLKSGLFHLLFAV